MDNGKFPSSLSSVDTDQKYLLENSPPVDTISTSGTGQDLLSQIPQGGLSVDQVQQLLNTIQDLQSENNELRNNLHDTTAVMQEKELVMRELQIKQKEWMDKMKQRQTRASETMKKLRREKKDLAERVEKQTGGVVSDGSKADQIISKLQKELQDASTKIVELEQLSGTPEYQSKDLTKTQEDLEKAREELNETKDHLNKVKESNRKEFQMFRTKMDETLTNNQKEIKNYKQQITSVLNELKDKEKIIVNQRAKVTELHKANSDFDSLTKALQSKLAMYDEEMDRSQSDIQNLRKSNLQTQQHYSALQQEQHVGQKERQRLESKMQELQNELQKIKTENREMRDNLGRVVAEKISLEESLEARSDEIVRLKSELKDKMERERMLREQTALFQTNYQSEKVAKERNHQVIQECQLQLQALRDQNAQLQKEVDSYNHERMRNVHRQYNPTYANYPSPPQYSPTGLGNQSFSPTGHQSFSPPGMSPSFPQSGTTPRSYYGDDRSGIRSQRTTPEHHEFKCPMCGEVYAELESLEIHVQDCVK